MADLLGQLNHEVDEKGKQLNDVQRQLSRCTDAAQQGVLQGELSQLESTIDDLIALRKLLIPLALSESVPAGGAGLRGQPVAVGAGGGVAGAGAPPAAPRRLVDSAAKLQLLPQRSDDDGVVWKLTYGHSARTYVDAAGVVDRIRLWAEAALRVAVMQEWGHVPAPLLVSGLVKTGKSYTLEHVVPAVVAEVLRKQRQAEQQQQQQAKQQPAEHGLLAGMVVLRLKGDQLDRSSGAAIMLQSLLIVLLEWARQEHVPLRAGALAAAEAALALPDMGMPSIPGRAIFAFLKAVEVPVLVLCDEVQQLFLPLIGGAELDVAGAVYVRDVFMKQLLLDGPHTVLWCLTGLGARKGSAAGWQLALLLDATQRAAAVPAAPAGVWLRGNRVALGRAPRGRTWREPRGLLGVHGAARDIQESRGRSAVGGN